MKGVKNLRFEKEKLIFLALILAMSVFSPASSDAAPKIEADAAILMDVSSGQVLYDKHGSKRRSPASLTKIMTGIIALEYSHLGEVVTVSRKAGAVSTGSTIGLQAGDEITLSNLLEAALLSSANDSTVAIAEHIGLSHDAFIHLMNKKAVALGAFQTRFANTNGYSNPNHYSTAQDLAIITRYALQNEFFNRLVSTKETTVAWYEPIKEKDIKNTNRVLTQEEYPGIDGVKTGTAIKAGKCYIASATRDGRRLIAVILHSSKRYDDAVELLDYGFNSTDIYVLCQQGQAFPNVSVSEGIKSSVPAIAKEKVSAYLDTQDPPEVQGKVIASKLTAPVNKGDIIGQVIFTTDQGELGRTDLVAKESVRKPWWPVRIWK
ncbi:MAG: D-alanyl-D-alanine carboxypeptidase [Firmicutes bacterium]|nr:D-alanyl-D-alanine carboxypeptidase [Bacillota bacterium]